MYVKFWDDQERYGEQSLGQINSLLLEPVIERLDIEVQKDK
jgi:hypothetical protein